MNEGSDEKMLRIEFVENDILSFCFQQQVSPRRLAFRDFSDKTFFRFQNHRLSCGPPCTDDLPLNWRISELYNKRFQRWWVWWAGILWILARAGISVGWVESGWKMGRRLEPLHLSCTCRNGTRLEEQSVKWWYFRTPTSLPPTSYSVCLDR